MSVLPEFQPDVYRRTCHHCREGIPFVFDVFVDGKSRLELSQLDFFPQTEHIEAVAQNMQRPLLIDGLPQTAQQCLARSGPVVLCQSVPCGRLRRLNPSQNVSGKQRQFAVILGGILVGVLPTLSGQMFANLDFEADLFVQAHQRPLLAIWLNLSGIFQIAVYRLCQMTVFMYHKTVNVTRKSFCISSVIHKCS